MKFSKTLKLFTYTCLISTLSGSPYAKADHLDLNKESFKFLEYVKSPNFTLENCPDNLSNMYEELYSVEPSAFNVNSAKKHYVEITENLWHSRIELRQRLRGFIQMHGTSDPQVKSCANATKNTLRATRYVEDYLGELTLAPPPFDFKKNGKNKAIKKSDILGLNYPPHFLQNPKTQKVSIRSGDLLVSRGNAFTSAAISRIGEIDAQFSHLALVYIDKSSSQQEFTIEEAIKSSHVKLIEAHIEVGTTVRTFKEYIEDGNARILFFRYNPNQQQDSSPTETSANGAQYSYDFVLDRQIENRERRLRHWQDERYKDLVPFPPAKNSPVIFDVNDHVPYDFKMILGDTSEVFCSEWGYIAYAHQGVILPQFPTAIPSTNALSKALGIRVKETFAPGDMDVETRFVLQAEWRDFRKVRNLRHKDAVLTKVFSWMEEDQWEFELSFGKNIKALFVWISRFLDMPYTKEELPRNMPLEAIKTVFALDKVGEELQNYTEHAELEYQRNNNGLLMPFSEMYRQLEKARADIVCKPTSPLNIIIGQTGLKFNSLYVCP